MTEIVLFSLPQVSISIRLRDHRFVLPDQVQRGADQSLVFSSEAQARSQLDARGGQIFDLTNTLSLVFPHAAPSEPKLHEAALCGRNVKPQKDAENLLDLYIYSS